MHAVGEAQDFREVFYSILNPRSPILVIAILVAITLAACSSTPSRPKPGGYYLQLFSTF